MSVSTLNTGPYTIKARGGHARAFLTSAPAGSGYVVEAKEDTDEAAISAVRDLLAAMAAKRPICQSYGVATPTTRDLELALSAAQRAATVDAMMEALVRAGSAGLTAGELAEAAGYADYGSANLHLGTACAKLADVLGMELPPATIWKDRDVATAFIAVDGEPRKDTGHWTWVARPEFKAAWELR